MPTVSTVNAEAVNALNQRHGFGNQPLNPFPPNPYYAFALKEEPEGFWVAESTGEIIGYSLSWMRHSFWFLGMLFVLSTHQGKGSRAAPSRQSSDVRQPGPHTESVSIIVAGSNEQGLAIALSAGMRIASPLLLMSAKPFGNWGSYLFLSPALL